MVDARTTVLASDLAADKVANAEFSSSFRGFDPAEVRSFLSRVAGELKSLREREARTSQRIAELEAELAAVEPVSAQVEVEERPSDIEFDEQRMTELLGVETARVLEAARSAAAEIRSKAERTSVEKLAAADEAVKAQREAAEADATQMRSAAENVLVLRTEEAEQAAAALTDEAEREATRIRSEAEAIRTQATHDAAAAVDAARQDGRRMIAEARAVRERILTDMARRRNTARQQIEKLRAARERLLESIDGVRGTLDGITADLHGSLVDAKLAGERAARQQDVNFIPPMSELDAEVETAKDTGLIDVAGIEADLARPLAEVDVADTGELPVFDTGETAIIDAKRAGEFTANDAVAASAEASDVFGEDDDLPDEDVADVDVSPDDVDAVVESVEADAPAVDDELVEDEPVEDALVEEELVDEDNDLDAVEVEADEFGEDEDDETDEDDSVGSEAVDVVDLTGASGAAPHDDGGGTAIDYEQKAKSVFNRLRSDIEGGGVAATSVGNATATNGHSTASALLNIDVLEDDAETDGAEPEDGETDGELVDEPEEISADRATLQTRDARLAGIARDLGRQLKMSLSDEQNVLLELVRGDRARDVTVELLPPVDEQREIYESAVLDAASLAAEEGWKSIAGADADPEEVDVTELVDAVLAELSDELREKVEAALADPDTVEDQIRSIYREIRNRRVADLSEHVAFGGYGRAQLDAAILSEPAVKVRWVFDSCAADCLDNSLADAVEAGEEFPTGHCGTPAFVGCRCTLVVGD